VAVVSVAPKVYASTAQAFAPLAFDAFDRRRDAPINEEPNYRSDGVYGRFDGEITFVPSLGVAWSNAGWFTQLGLSAYYLHTIGLTARTADGRWSPIPNRADYSVSSLSLALRPLFLLRWSNDWEKGPSFLDLTVDSLTLCVGGYWASRHGDDEQYAGFESELSFGFPLLGRADGPWLTASAMNRLPKVTSANKNLDMGFGLRFEWAFSLGG
jgi:hypothetical protein